ncbi:hypothetical protein ACTA71_009431 [Dictyostelium dimigraforme]
MLSELYNKLTSSNYSKKKIAILGLDAAGKTTLLYKLKLGEIVSHVPTIGFYTEIVDCKKFSILAFDTGPIQRIQSLERSIYKGSNAVIYVIDSGDHYRMDQVKQDFNKLLNEKELKDSIFLIFVNKQDLKGSMKVNEIIDLLDLNSIKDRKWHIQPCSAINSFGICEGFDWVSDNI